MNAPFNSVNNVILGDNGRYPFNIEASKRCIKCWLKITDTCMPYERYDKICYNMLKLLDENGHINWVTKVRSNVLNKCMGESVRQKF